MKNKVWKHRQALIDKRKYTGQSLRQLANELGISFSDISRVESGKGDPSTHNSIIFERWLFPDEEDRICKCIRCNNNHLPLLSRVIALEEAVEDLKFDRIFDTNRRIG